MALNLKKNTEVTVEKEEKMRGIFLSFFFPRFIYSHRDEMVIKFGNYDATEANSFRHPR